MWWHNYRESRYANEKNKRYNFKPWGEEIIRVYFLFENVTIWFHSIYIHYIVRWLWSIIMEYFIQLILSFITIYMECGILWIINLPTPSNFLMSKNLWFVQKFLTFFIQTIHLSYKGVTLLYMTTHLKSEQISLLRTKSCFRFLGSGDIFFIIYTVHVKSVVLKYCILKLHLVSNTKFCRL